MRYVLALVVTLSLAFLATGSQAVMAQQGPGGGTGPALQGEQGRQNPASFNDRKARILKMFEQRKARMDEEKACVEKATNDDELVKCRPMGPGRGGQGMGGPGPRGPMGGQGQPPMPMEGM
ncbi:MAG TPA: hypothetical protein VIU40_13850 [Geobacteraceae bacterium]